MSKADEYIRNKTRIRVNDITRNFPWVTTEEAIEAIKIAREEIYKWLTNHYRDYMHNPTGEKLEAFFGMDMITDLKQAMKDET